MKMRAYKGKFDVASARRSFAQKFGRRYGLKLLDLQKLCIGSADFENLDGCRFHSAGQDLTGLTI